MGAVADATGDNEPKIGRLAAYEGRTFASGIVVGQGMVGQGMFGLAPGGQGMSGLALGGQGMFGLAPGRQGMFGLAPGGQGMSRLLPNVRAVFVSIDRTST